MSIDTFRKRFGDIAVEKGFITQEELAQALAQQHHQRVEGADSRLIGSILYRQGVISIWQVIEVLKCLQSEVDANAAAAAETADLLEM